MNLVTIVVLLGGVASLLSPRERRRMHSKGLPPSQKEAEGNHTYVYCQQLVDHFAKDSHKSPETWCQKYLYNNEFAKHDRCRRPVVLLYTGGESPSLPDNVVTESNVADDMMSLAKEIGAIAMALEHRYYGHEKPTSNLSAEVLKKTFTSDQAVADVARFRDFAASNYNLEDAQFVTFGGSYPGVVAAWARAQYPDKFVAAVSSSAPIEARLDFPEYNEALGLAFTSDLVGGSIACASAIQQAHAKVGEMLENPEGRRELEKAFNICGTRMLDNINNRKLWAFEGLLGFSSQSNDPRCDGSLCNIDKMCRYFTDPNTTDSLVERLAVINRRSQEECEDVDFSTVAQVLKNDSDDNWMKMWTFQTCNEFGFYQTCNSSRNCLWTPGIDDLEWNLLPCKIGWGFTPEEVAANIEKTNRKHGGLSLNNATRIVSINGGIDPWHRLALITSNSPDLPTIWVPSASHHYWTHQRSGMVEENLERAREGIRRTVKKWLHDDNQGDEDSDTLVI